MDRQSTYVMDELSARELTVAEKNSIMAIFREMVKSSGLSEQKQGNPEEMRGTTGAVISWSEAEIKDPII